MTSAAQFGSQFGDFAPKLDGPVQANGNSFPPQRNWAEANWRQSETNIYRYFTHPVLGLCECAVRPSVLQNQFDVEDSELWWDQKNRIIVPFLLSNTVNKKVTRTTQVAGSEPIEQELHIGTALGFRKCTPEDVKSYWEEYRRNRALDEQRAKMRDPAQKEQEVMKIAAEAMAERMGIAFTEAMAKVMALSSNPAGGAPVSDALIKRLEKLEANQSAKDKETEQLRKENAELKARLEQQATPNPTPTPDAKPGTRRAQPS